MAKQISYWLDAPYRARKPLRGTIRADVAIVGGGITGVSAAYHLAKKRFKVVLIEKDTLASGASGKNTGMLIEGLSLDFFMLVKQFGANKALASWKNTVLGRKGLVELVKKHNIKCGLHKTGSLYLALNKKQESVLKKEFAARRKFGLKCEFLNKKQVSKVIPDKFQSGIFVADDYLLSSAKFIRGLAPIAERLGAHIYEHTPALKIGPKEVLTSNGKILAKKVFVALESYNPFTEKLHRSNILVIVTKPLSKAKLEKLGWKKGGMLWEATPAYNVIRMVDSRFMIANSCPNKRAIKKVKGEFTKTLLRYFPTLTKEDLQVSHQWTCTTLHLPDRLPFIGKINGLYHSFAYGGNGMSQGFMSGKLIAEHFAGKPIPDRYSNKKRAPEQKPEFTF